MDRVQDEQGITGRRQGRDPTEEDGELPTSGKIDDVLASRFGNWRAIAAYAQRALVDYALMLVELRGRERLPDDVVRLMGNPRLSWTRVSEHAATRRTERLPSYIVWAWALHQFAASMRARNGQTPQAATREVDAIELGRLIFLTGVDKGLLDCPFATRFQFRRRDKLRSLTTKLCREIGLGSVELPEDAGLRGAVRQFFAFFKTEVRRNYVGPTTVLTLLLLLRARVASAVEAAPLPIKVGSLVAALGLALLLLSPHRPAPEVSGVQHVSARVATGLKTRGAGPTNERLAVTPRQSAEVDRAPIKTAETARRPDWHLGKVVPLHFGVFFVQSSISVSSALTSQPMPPLPPRIYGSGLQGIAWEAQLGTGFAAIADSKVACQAVADQDVLLPPAKKECRALQIAWSPGTVDDTKSVSIECGRAIFNGDLHNPNVTGLGIPCTFRNTSSVPLVVKSEATTWNGEPTVGSGLMPTEIAGDLKGSPWLDNYLVRYVPGTQRCSILVPPGRDEQSADTAWCGSGIQVEFDVAAKAVEREVKVDPTDMIVSGTAVLHAVTLQGREVTVETVISEQAPPLVITNQRR